MGAEDREELIQGSQSPGLGYKNTGLRVETDGDLALGGHWKGWAGEAQGPG